MTPSPDISVCLCLAAVALSACNAGSSSALPMSPDERYKIADTPPERLCSRIPYKVVLRNGRVYLEFHHESTEPFGPFRYVSPDEYVYEVPDEGVRSIQRFDFAWWYSQKYVAMAGVPVEASELERLAALGWPPSFELEGPNENRCWRQR